MPTTRSFLLHELKRIRTRNLLLLIFLTVICCLLLSLVPSARVVSFARTQDPILFFITPTKPRVTQKAELTRLSQTLQLVKNCHWIVIEDASGTSPIIEKLLRRSGLSYTHLAVNKSTEPQMKGRGMTQRNLGLEWLRKTYRDRGDVRGVVYFMDDDNCYDLRLFEAIRNVRHVAVWPVALAGGYFVEYPKVLNGTVNH